MANFLRKLFGYQSIPQPTSEDTDLTKFYTNSEHELELFEQMMIATALSKRLLVIHGLGGVGKSTLLKMYAFFCRQHHVPVALVASEETPSPVDVLTAWADDLSRDEVMLPSFQKTLKHYRAIQAKVEAEAKKAHQTVSRFAGTMGKATAKAAIGMALSAIPVVGPIASALGSESTEAFLDWLHGFLSTPDMEFYLDPKGQLDEAFLSDLAQVAIRRRIVLMIDTYEQMTTLDEWMRELARRLSGNILLVIASRTVPNWDRAWQGWMGKAEIVELQEMTPNDLRSLIQRYYTYIRSGIPDPKQVEAIVQFARGLPMVATTVVQLWVKYHLEDFQMVRPQVVADLVDRLLEGVPQETRPAFEVAAVLRYFNVEALGTLLDHDTVEILYAELRKWPFIRSRREGLAVHGIMRDMINEALRVRTPERFRLLHERAARYYEVQLEKAIGEEREHYALEQLYHRVCADESYGAHLFQELAEELTRYRLVNRLRLLLNDVNTYPFEQENSHLWREYYSARLAHLESRINYAEKIYQEIGENADIEPKLQAYALCDWGGILCRRERLRLPGMEEKAIHLLESSLHVRESIDVKLAMSWVYLSDIYIANANWEKALFYLDQAKHFFVERKDYSGLLAVLYQERGIYARQGNFRKTFDLDKEMWENFTAAGEPSYLRTRVYPTWEWIWAGRYAQIEKEYRAALEVAKSLQDQEYLCWKTRDLGLCLSLQGKCSESLATVEKGLTLARGFGSGGEFEVFMALSVYGIAYMKCGDLGRAEEYLNQAIIAGQKVHAHLDKAPLYLAALYEVLSQFDKAEYFYQLTQAEALQLNRNHLNAGALTGLVRVKYAQNDFAALLLLWTEAERLAQQYEYNDFLASLYLTRGHIIWEGLIPEWGSNFDSVLHYYQLALIHALRFNRFLLDETLVGLEQGLPLRPITMHCLERGMEGQKMLVALRDWWQSGFNSVGKPRPDTISLLREDIALLEAERIARNQEPGNGLHQLGVLEQINALLNS